MSIFEDPIFAENYEKAKPICTADGFSVSNLQRKLGIGYTLAARIVDELKNEPSGKCVVCKRNFIGWGNNAEPFKKGRCCDTCNNERVVPLRLMRAKKK